QGRIGELLILKSEAVGLLVSKNSSLEHPSSSDRDVISNHLRKLLERQEEYDVNLHGRIELVRVSLAVVQPVTSLNDVSVGRIRDVDFQGVPGNVDVTVHVHRKRVVLFGVEAEPYRLNLSRYLMKSLPGDRDL